MTDKELLKDLKMRMSLQMDLINRYTSAGKFAPDFYYEELHQMHAEYDKIEHKLKAKE